MNIYIYKEKRERFKYIYTIYLNEFMEKGGSKKTKRGKSYLYILGCVMEGGGLKGGGFRLN